MIAYQFLQTPIGVLRLTSNGSSLTGIEFDGRHSVQPGETEKEDAVLARCKTQLQEYFHAEREKFDLPLEPGGTAFQHSVWQALQKIPYGATRSYADIARAIERSKAVRAVGTANGANPLPIVIPCHRVVASDGRLSGFAGGIATKRWLLDMEGAGGVAPLKH